LGAASLLVLLHTIIFLVRGSCLKINCIGRVLDDFCECMVDEEYVFRDSELELMEDMREDATLFERVVNTSRHEGLGYMLALYSLPYIGRK